MIPIPYGQKYTTTLRGRVPKLVKCEQCSLEYVYQLSRSARGEGTSFLFLNNEGAQSSAEEEARARLLAALMKACEPVPCPGCGHVQEHMVPRARQLRHRWMGPAAVCLLLATLVLCLPAIPAASIAASERSPVAFIVAGLLWLLVAASAAGTFVLPVWKYFTNRRYDPNAGDVEARKQLGQRLAVSREEFEKQQSNQGAS